MQIDAYVFCLWSRRFLLRSIHASDFGRLGLKRMNAPPARAMATRAMATRAADTRVAGGTGECLALRAVFAASWMQKEAQAQ